VASTTEAERIWWRPKRRVIGLVAKTQFVMDKTCIQGDAKPVGSFRYQSIRLPFRLQREAFFIQLDSIKLDLQLFTQLEHNLHIAL